MAATQVVTLSDDATALAEAAAESIVEAAAAAVADHGRFTIVLAGGGTPRATYMRLAAPPFAERMPWDRTSVFFGDERCVPADHPESNYRMANETLLSKVPIPSANVFRMHGEADDSEDAAADYARTLAVAFATPRGGLPRFDLVLLGMGLDGHTASLFPGSPAAKEIFRTVVAVHAAAASIPQRLTLTLPALNAAARVAFLVSGAEKAKVVRSILRDGMMLPAGMVRPADGALTWMLDRAAASLLSPDDAGRGRR
ncbi:MAG TPA: 6-phosphogluconolactonase [Solirubrobacteraceae bacterium]|jgi:6-phosphogluconolactonase